MWGLGWVVYGVCRTCGGQIMGCAGVWSVCDLGTGGGGRVLPIFPYSYVPTPQK